MRKNVTAALLSGLVFPGVGQWWLGRRGRGFAFLAPAALCGYAYLQYSLDAAWALADQVLAGRIDPAAVAAEAAGQATPLWVGVAGFGFIVCWAGSVVDACLVRKP